MTAPSPVDLATGAVGFTVTSNGTALPASLQIVSIDIWTGVNRLPKARIIISDGAAGDEDFEISDTDQLVPGVVVTIALGYSGAETQVFAGIIYRQGLEATINGPPRLVVEVTDKAMVMTLARANAVYQNITDSALCQKLISAAGLSAKVTSTSTSHESIVQYYASAWDLMILRAQANGMVTTVDDGTVTIAPPDTGTAPVLTLTFGDSILDFRGDMDASTQYAASAITSYAWDPATQAVVNSTGAQADISTPGNISSAALAKVFGVSAYIQQSAGAVAAAELTDWASAELVQSQLSKIRGSVRFQGSALAVPTAMVTLAGLGARFNGNAWVAGVHHRLAEGLWRTTLELGLSPNSFAAIAPQVAAPGAAGLLPPIHNLQVGTVSQIDQDPDGEFRVAVMLPLLRATDPVWARLGAFTASNGFGAFFYPEIGDEVIIAFLGGDPRYPVVLGSLYSKTRPPPFVPAAENNTKSIVTRSLLHLDFLEDTKTVQIVTPGKQSIIVNDTEKSIVLADMNGNSISLDPSGIAMKSASDISITATGSITITADNGLTATGTASAQLKSTGVVQVKGATVALNP
jgi:Rhs element Vgr protein